MIKIETGKGKTLTFDINIRGRDNNEIKETRFILSCPNKSYRLVFPAIIENNSVSVDLPPLDIQGEIGSCSLEMISSDNQYYQIWTDDVKFDNELKIVVKEQKSKERKVIVESKNKEITEVKNVPVKKGIKNILNEYSKRPEFIRLYRTIKCDQKTFNKIISENKFLMKPKPGINIIFYKTDHQLLNDIENIEYGISIAMNISSTEIIKENKDNTVIVNSTNLDGITENNVVFLINKGRLIQLNSIKNYE